MHTAPIWTAVRVLFFAAFACRFGYLIFTAMKSGVARTAGKEHKRRKSPGMFWTTIVIHALFLLALVFFGARDVLNDGGLWANK